MNIDVNQYDLNELFRFDLLKNILQNVTNDQKKLAEEVKKLSEEIKELKLSNNTRDEKINSLEKFNNLKMAGLEDELNEISDELSENIDKKNMTFEKLKKGNNINKENKNSFRKTADSKDNIFNKRQTPSGDTKSKISKATMLFFMK